MLNHALHLLSLGYSVIPLKPKSKEPLIPWKEFQSRLATSNEVKDWFQKTPTANIGIVTGKVSCVAVVDLDGPDGLASALKLGLSSSLVSLTGNGKQLWHHLGGDVLVQNAVRKYPGLDIRGDGGYVVAPPSIHPNGRRYKFNRPVLSVEKLPLFPASLFASAAAPILAAEPIGRNETSWIAKALEEMTNGNIDDTLFRICSRLRNDGYSRTDCSVLLSPHAERVGASEGHLEDKINNVWGRYEPKRNFHSADEQRTAGGLVLHSPTNPDSLDEFKRRSEVAEGLGSQINTGYSNFDTLTKGLKKGEVLTVAARTGIGKTNWIMAPIRTFCEADKTVLLFSTEMSFDQIWSRYQALVGDSFGGHKFYVCDEFTPNIERIEEAIKNVSPDLFIFDHISHIGTDHHIISKFMSEIKRLCRAYSIPAIVTAQLNRNADYVDQGQRIEPRLSMIQGSDQIGQMSAQVLLLNEKRINGDVTEIEGIVVKNRHGNKGLVQFILASQPYYHMREA